jgi:hypothetical protein
VSDKPQEVVIKDLDISFSNLIGLWVKVAIAAIPAGIILALFGFVTITILGGCSHLLR